MQPSGIAFQAFFCRHRTKPARCIPRTSIHRKPVKSAIEVGHSEIEICRNGRWATGRQIVCHDTTLVFQATTGIRRNRRASFKNQSAGLVVLIGKAARLGNLFQARGVLRTRSWRRFGRVIMTYLPTRMCVREARSPSTLNTHRTTPITTTAFRIDLIELAIGMKRFTSHKRIPTTISVTITRSNGILYYLPCPSGGGCFVVWFGPQKHSMSRPKLRICRPFASFQSLHVRQRASPTRALPHASPQQALRGARNSLPRF